LIEGGDTELQDRLYATIRHHLIQAEIDPVTGAAMVTEIVGLMVREAAAGATETPGQYGEEKLAILEYLQRILLDVVNADMVANDNVILPPGSA
tara:strand:- start:175 stop:456 length:282 start_codon:yes stop_codon:yes gene_type:complete